MGRAAVSVMANIVYPVKYVRTFLFHGAGGSTAEVENQLYLALDQSYITQDQFDAIYQQAVQVKNLLHGFIRYLRKSKPGKED